MPQVPYLKTQDPVLGQNLRVGANDITLLLDKMSELPTNKKVSDIVGNVTEMKGKKRQNKALSLT